MMRSRVAPSMHQESSHHHQQQAATASDKLQRRQSFGGHGKYFEVEALLESIASEAVGALKGSFIVDLMMQRKPLLRRQDLPPEAFWSVEELYKIFDGLKQIFDTEEATSRFCKMFVAISYRWLGAGAPDPDAFHLKIIGNASRLYMRNPAATGLCSLVFSPLGLKKVDFAIFWDWASLFQPERTAEQKTLFKAGLNASNIWYGHRHTVMWMQSSLPRTFDTSKYPTYATSGWCYVEACLSCMLKPGEQRLDLGLRDVRSKSYAAYLKKCVAGRSPPVLCDVLACSLRAEKTFTSRADVEVVIELYHSFMDAVAPAVESLELSGLRWSDAEVVELTHALPLFQRLEELDVSRNAIGALSGRAIAKVLDECSTLARLNLDGYALDLAELRGTTDVAAGGKCSTTLAVSQTGAVPRRSGLSRGPSSTPTATTPPRRRGPTARAARSAPCCLPTTRS